MTRIPTYLGLNSICSIAAVARLCVAASLAFAAGCDDQNVTSQSPSKPAQATQAPIVAKAPEESAELRDERARLVELQQEHDELVAASERGLAQLEEMKAKPDADKAIYSELYQNVGGILRDKAQNERNIAESQTRVQLLKMDDERAQRQKRREALSMVDQQARDRRDGERKRSQQSLPDPIEQTKRVDDELKAREARQASSRITESQQNSAPVAKTVYAAVLPPPTTQYLPAPKAPSADEIVRARKAAEAAAAAKARADELAAQAFQAARPPIKVYVGGFRTTDLPKESGQAAHDGVAASLKSFRSSSGRRLMATNEPLTAKVYIYGEVLSVDAWRSVDRSGGGGEAVVATARVRVHLERPDGPLLAEAEYDASVRLASNTSRDLAKQKAASAAAEKLTANNDISKVLNEIARTGDSR